MHFFKHIKKSPIPFREKFKKSDMCFCEIF